MKSKYDKKTLRAFHTALEQGATAKEAGEKVGIKPATAASYATRWRNKQAKQAETEKGQQVSGNPDILRVLSSENKQILGYLKRILNHLESGVLSPKPKVKEPSYPSLIPEKKIDELELVDQEFIDLMPQIAECEISGYTFQQIISEFKNLDSGSLLRIQESNKYKEILQEVKQNE